MTDANQEGHLRYLQWASKYKTKRNNNERTHSLQKRDSDCDVVNKKGCKYSMDECALYPKDLSGCSRRRRILMRLTKVKHNEQAEPVNQCVPETKEETHIIGNRNRECNLETLEGTHVIGSRSRERNMETIEGTHVTVNRGSEQISASSVKQNKVRNSDYVCVYSASESDTDDSGRQKLNVLIRKYKTSDHNNNVDSKDTKNIGRTRWRRGKRERTRSDSENRLEFEVRQKDELVKKLRKVDREHLNIAQSCHSAENEYEDSDLCKGDPNINQEITSSKKNSFKCNAKAKVENKMAESIHCELCKEIFLSDGKLDDHYLTHFKTIKGLNTFLNKRRKRKVSVWRNGHSILKKSRKKKSDVKKKVVFEMDIDEGVDCRSPEINGVEAVDLLTERECCFEGKGKEVKSKYKPETQTVKIKRKEKTNAELNVKAETVNYAGITMDESCLENYSEHEKLIINVDGERMYCDHNTDLARLCLLKDVKVMLSPLYLACATSFGNLESDSNVSEDDTDIDNVGSFSENPHIKQTTMESKDVIESDANANHNENALKLTLKLRKENNCGLETRTKLLPGVIDKNELDKMFKPTDDSEHVTSDANAKRNGFKSLDRIPIKSSKFFKKVLRNSDEKNGSPKCFLNLKNIKKDLLGWTKEFERIKLLTEDIANSQLLAANTTANVRNDIEDNLKIQTDKEKTKSDKLKRLKCDGIAKEHSKEKVNIVQSAKHTRERELSCERNMNDVSFEKDRVKEFNQRSYELPSETTDESEQFAQENNSGNATSSKVIHPYIERKTEKNLSTSVTKLKSQIKQDNSIKDYCMQEANMTERCEGKNVETNQINEDLNLSLERKWSVQNGNKIRNSPVRYCSQARDEVTLQANSKVVRDCENLETKSVNLEACVEQEKQVDGCAEVFGVYNIEKGNIDMSNNGDYDCISSCNKRLHDVEKKSIDSRKYEVQDKLEQMNSYIISKEDYFSKMVVEKTLQGSHDVNGNFISVAKRSEHKDMQAIEQVDKLHRNRTTDILKDQSAVKSDILVDNDLIEHPDEYDSRIQDACYDDILIEFAEEVGIVLNSPDKAAMMFDENALYENLENLSLKDSSSCDDSAPIVENYESETTESIGSLGRIDDTLENAEAGEIDRTKHSPKNVNSALKSDVDKSSDNKVSREVMRNYNILRSMLENKKVKVDDTKDFVNVCKKNLAKHLPVRSCRNNENKSISVNVDKDEKEIGIVTVKDHSEDNTCPFVGESKYNNSINKVPDEKLRAIVLVPGSVNEEETVSKFESEREFKQNFERKSKPDMKEQSFEIQNFSSEGNDDIEGEINERNTYGKNAQQSQKRDDSLQISQKCVIVKDNKTVTNMQVSDSINKKKKWKHHSENSNHEPHDRKHEHSRNDDKIADTENTETEKGENAPNSHDIYENNTNVDLIPGIGEAKCEAGIVSKFYRCVKCKRLYYGIEKRDSTSCANCKDNESKTCHEVKRSGNNNVAILKDLNQLQGIHKMSANIGVAHNKVKTESSEGNKLDKTNVARDFQTQNGDAINRTKSLRSRDLDNAKRVKLVLHKIKTPLSKSGDNEVIGSPDRPCWKVQMHEKKVTPLKVTCSSAGNWVEKVKSYNEEKTVQGKSDNKDNHTIKKPVKNESESKISKQKEFKRSEITENIKSFAHNISREDKDIEAKGRIRKKLKPETKQNQVNQLQKKPAYTDAPNEFEKALWDDFTGKRNDKSKKKGPGKVKTLKNDQTEEESLAQNKTVLFPRKKTCISSTRETSVQHFQKSKMAQLIYNKHQKKTVSDELPNFSATKLDLKSLPPLSVSQKDTSFVDNKGKDISLLFFKKELELSETSSSSSESPMKITTEAKSNGCNLKISSVGSDTKDSDKMLNDTKPDGNNDTEIKFDNAKQAENRGIAANFDTINASVCPKTNGNISNSVRVDGYSGDLKDLKKELATVVMKDNIKTNDFVKSFTPGFNFASPWHRENNGNKSISVLPSFSETFIKRPTISVGMNQTFNGFTKFERDSCSNFTEISSKTDCRSSDHDSAFTEISEQGVDADTSSDPPNDSMFAKLDKQKSLEDSSASTIYPMLGPVSSPVRDEDISPVYSPEVVKPPCGKFMEGKRNDFSSTPALKLFSCKSMLDDTLTSALDISQISHCSSTVCQEETKALKVSQQQDSSIVCDTEKIEPKRRKIKRLELTEPVSMEMDDKENKSGCQDTQMPSMLIISAECSQIDFSKLEEVNFPKIMQGNELKQEKGTIIKKGCEMYCGIGDDKVCDIITDGVKCDTLVVERNKENLKLNAADKIGTLCAGNGKADINNNVRIDNDIKESANNNVEHSVDYSEENALNVEQTGNNSKERAMNSNIEHAIESALKKNVENTIENNIEGDVNNNVEIAMSNNVEITFSNNVESPLNINIECTVENNVKDAIEYNMESAIERNIESLIEINVKSAIESNVESAIENNMKSIIENNVESAIENHAEIDEEADVSSNEDNEDNDGDVTMESEKDDDNISTGEGDLKRKDSDLDLVLDDVLELYASDEDASFLLDNDQAPSPRAIKDNITKGVEQSCGYRNDTVTKGVEQGCGGRDLKLDINCSSTGSLKTETYLQRTALLRTPPVLLKQRKPVLPWTTIETDQVWCQQEVPAFQPMKSNPLKYRWMPPGWCFKHFNRKSCSKQCTFRHDVPPKDVLNRCMPDIIRNCKKGELNSAMNMLESQTYFQRNIPEDDLDCLYGYSVNHLNMEYCHILLQLIASRNLVKQGHIDDIIYLWKRLVNCEDVSPLNDAFHLAKESNIFPNPRAVIILLETFSTFNDVYMLWDVITYCTVNKDYVIPEQYIRKAVSLLVTCTDTYVLSAAISWLQKSSPEQHSNINVETLFTLANSLQQRNMLGLATSLRQWFNRKNVITEKTSRQNLPRSNFKSNCADANIGLSENKQRTVHAHSRPVTPSNSDHADDHNSINGLADKPKQILSLNDPGAETLEKHDSTDFSKLKSKQLTTNLFKSERIYNQPDTSDSGIGNNEKERKRSGTLLKPRAVTHTRFTDFGSRGSKELRQQDILNEIKLACDASNWQKLADLFIVSCKKGSLHPDVFDRFLLALTKNHTAIGLVWTNFIEQIKQKQRDDIRLDNHTLSILGSEIFYFCYRMNLCDARDVLLVILRTEFLSLSQFVSSRWNICLELEAAEFLSKTGLPAESAKLVLELPSTGLEIPDVEDRLSTLIQLLIEKLYMEESFSLAFQVFRVAYRLKHKALRKIASDLIKSCLQVKLVNVPVQVYELYVADNQKFDIRGTVKRSLLNAFVQNKLELGKSLYRDMIQCSVLFPQQSHEKPRCVCIQSTHTSNEMKMIIKHYLIDLYDICCDLFMKSNIVASEELSLDVAIQKLASQVHPVGLPYVSQVQMSPLLVKVILLTEFGIHSDLNIGGSAKVTIHPDSLEKYIKNLDVTRNNIGLEFSWYSPGKNRKKLKTRR